jgi:hypothetical protein
MGSWSAKFPFTAQHDFDRLEHPAVDPCLRRFSLLLLLKRSIYASLLNAEVSGFFFSLYILFLFVFFRIIARRFVLLDTWA